MDNELIYCPNCKKLRHFVLVEKNVRRYGFPKDETVTVGVIQCEDEDCQYPLGIYQEPIYPDTEEK